MTHPPPGTPFTATTRAPPFALAQGSTARPPTARSQRLASQRHTLQLRSGCPANRYPIATAHPPAHRSTTIATMARRSVSLGVGACALALALVLASSSPLAGALHPGAQVTSVGAPRPALDCYWTVNEHGGSVYPSLPAPLRQGLSPDTVSLYPEGSPGWIQYPTELLEALPGALNANARNSLNSLDAFDTLNAEVKAVAPRPAVAVPC